MKRIILIAALAAFACHDAKFDQEIAKWRSDRRARLTADDGWLTLVALHWLHDGVNEVTLPASPPLVVRFVLANGHVTAEPNPSVTLDGKPLTTPVLLRDDTDDKGPTVLASGTLSFLAIKRGDRFGIRAKDTNSETRRQFKGLDYFPANPAYRVEAEFIPYNPPKKIPITNVLGMTGEEISPGALVFTLGERQFRIDPILEQGTTDLFIIFRDQTAGHETYPAARYVYAPPPKNGKTTIDFNKAYNPPCAFTHFATCPLPPPQNKLPIRIEAGEKKYAGAHG